MDAPTAERLSYVEGLRLQSAPQLGDPDFVDHRNPVRGGIPAHSAAPTAAQRGFNRFARRYPHLAEQVRRNPGRSSRNSYARETGGHRVAHGLLGEGLAVSGRERYADSIRGGAGKNQAGPEK